MLRMKVKNLEQRVGQLKKISVDIVSASLLATSGVTAIFQLFRASCRC